MFVTRFNIPHKFLIHSYRIPYCLTIIKAVKTMIHFGGNFYGKYRQQDFG